MNADTQLFFVTGAAGKLECALDLPKADPSGIVLIAHPHPLYGGTMSNKVVQMIARTFVALGYIAVRMNFRGVGASEGSHDFGNGETDDMAVLLDHIKKTISRLAWSFLAVFHLELTSSPDCDRNSAAESQPPGRMVFVSATAGKWAVDSVPADTLRFMAELDEVVPLPDVFTGATAGFVHVVVVAGADHLFNHKLHHIRNIITTVFPH